VPRRRSTNAGMLAGTTKLHCDRLKEAIFYIKPMLKPDKPCRQRLYTMCYICQRGRSSRSACHSQPVCRCLAYPLEPHSCVDKPGYRLDAQHDCCHSRADQDGQVPPPAPHDVAAGVNNHVCHGVQQALSTGLPVAQRQLMQHVEHSHQHSHLYSVAFRVKPFCRDAQEAVSDMQLHGACDSA
jgi:hypothetical protein